MTQQVTKASCGDQQSVVVARRQKLYGQTTKARNRGPGAVLVTFYGSTQEKAL